MTRGVILGCLAAGSLALVGYRLGCAAGLLQAAIAQTTDPAHEHCHAQEIRLLAQLRREVANVHRLDAFIFAQAERIDQLEHELAVSGGPAMVAEVEQYLQEKDP